MRKLCKVLLLFAFICFLTVNVKAETKTITIDELVESIQKTEYWKFYFEEYKVVKNASNNTINLVEKESNSSIIALNYTDEYVSYENTFSKDEFGEALLASIFIETIRLAEFNFFGYTNEQFENVTSHDIDYNYNDHGFEVIGEQKSDDSIYLKLKLSLNSSGVDNLVSKYGDQYVDSNDTIDVSNLMPYISLSKVSSNSVSLNVGIENYEADIEDTATCIIYRSTDNKNFEPLSFNPNCALSMTITDDDLKSNTVYYYKIRFTSGNKYSDVLKVTTLDVGASSGYTSSDDVITNPETGFYNIIAVAVIMIISGSLMFVFYKKATN